MTPTDTRAVAQHFFDIHADNALNAALAQAHMLLKNGDLAAAAAMGRVAALISEMLPVAAASMTA